jgi:hypothetical protein
MSPWAAVISLQLQAYPRKLLGFKRDCFAEPRTFSTRRYLEEGDWRITVGRSLGFPLQRLSPLCSLRVKPLISRIRCACVSKRPKRRKFPPVIRMIAATVSGSNSNESGSAIPAGLQRCANSSRTCWALCVRNSCTKPIRG